MIFFWRFHSGKRILKQSCHGNLSNLFYSVFGRYSLWYLSHFLSTQHPFDTNVSEIKSSIKNSYINYGPLRKIPFKKNLLTKQPTRCYIFAFGRNRSKKPIGQRPRNEEGEKGQKSFGDRLLMMIPNLFLQLWKKPVKKFFPPCRKSGE